MLAPLPAPTLQNVNESSTDPGTPDCNPFIVLYAGSLSQLAGVPLLLQSFERLKDDRFRLWIIGRGELEPVIRHAAATDTRIRYLGNLSRSDLLARYTTADVLVNPHSTVLLTARYVFPSKLLEYLASGRPVITTATPGIAADYGNFCTVLNREEPQALADAIKRVAALPAVDRLARSAKARVAVIERCTWSRQGRRLVRALDEWTSPATSESPAASKPPSRALARTAEIRQLVRFFHLSLNRIFHDLR
jgi:glycosyltransferase involved in cell wall biosynthesis